MAVLSQFESRVDLTVQSCALTRWMPSAVDLCLGTPVPWLAVRAGVRDMILVRLMRNQKVGKATLIGVLALTIWATAGGVSGLKPLYDQHRWFELRDAIKDQEAPPLYKGAVASAFNDTKRAERYLNQTIKSQPNSPDAEGAHGILAEVYVRAGRYKEAVQQLDEMLRIKPGSPHVENTRSIFAAWGKHSDQSVKTSRLSKTRADVRRDGVKLPVLVHGQTVHWLLDTGANFSLMSESEARRLGVKIDESSGSIADGGGGTTETRTAVVDELAIGDVRLGNAAFLILPDTQEPMSDWQPGERGVIGLPIAIALQSISWSSDGTFTIRSVSDRSTAANKNLCFDGLNPVTRLEFDGKELDFGFDTGDQSGSQLWTRFADDFAALLKQRGIKSSQRVTMVGGSNERESVILPEIQLRIGGLKMALRPAQVFFKPVGDDFHHGLLGMDVLSQAREVRIDFVSMTLELLP
jgi:hypothetical protein